jgi:hypothetical protein
MRHNKKQEKALKTIGIIYLVSAHCWEIFAYAVFA